MGKKAVSKTTKVAGVSLAEVNSPDDIPEFATDEEFRDFWDTHGLGPGWTDVGEARDPRLPPPRPRTTPVAIRFDADVVARLKAVAAKKHKGYQTLLKEFVSERLYEEEKREGLIQGS